MEMKQARVWVRIAGSKTRIMARAPQGWRCFIDPSREEIRIRDWKIAGSANERNFIAEFTPDEDPRGLFAWVKVFGDIEVRDEIAYVMLQDPEQSGS